MKGPYVILSPISKSHPFEERKAKVGSEDDPLKIGRAVARLKPCPDNAIFDCKVLSRNHAILWSTDNEFFIRDTKSSNGTFVNNDRLAVTGEDSKPKQIFTGDIIQLGVEIVENANKAHGCIYAMVQLFDNEGNLMEAASREAPIIGTIEKIGGLCSSQINNHQLFQLQQFIAEALYREEQRQKRVRELEEIIEGTEMAMEAARKAVVNEDRLLSRIETLEAQLANSGKNIAGDKLKEDMQTLLEDKAKFESMSKEALKRAQDQKAEAELKLSDIDRSLVATEEECNRLRKRLGDAETRLGELAHMYDSKQSELNVIRAAVEDSENRILHLEEEERNNMKTIEEINELRILDRALPSLIKHLMEAIRTEDYSAHEQNLVSLADLLKERGVGIPEIVPEPPINLSNDEAQIKQEPIPCASCAQLQEKQTVAANEYEICLKENLQLKSSVRDLEIKIAQLEDRTEIGKLNSEKQSLEMMKVRSISASCDKFSFKKTNDPLVASIALFSFVPWLAFVLLILLPIHSRFLAKKVD